MPEQNIGNKGFEVFTIELEPDFNHISTSQNDGVEECIIVIEGKIEMNINDIILIHDVIMWRCVIIMEIILKGGRLICHL